MSRTRLATVATLLAVALVPTSQGASKPPLFPVTIRAANGPVTLQQRPTRIVSLSPTATEDLFAIGAGPQVVAVDDQSNYPKSAPKTSLSAYNPNAEAIATYKPDLVVASDTNAEAALEKLGIPVLVEPAAVKIGDVYRELQELGAATGHPARAASVNEGIQQQLTKVIRSVPKADRHLTVFHELGPDLYSATSSTFIGRIYKLFGFRNIADGADKTGTGYPQLSAEYVLTQNPQLIVLSDTLCCRQSAKTVAARPGWSGIAAVETKRVVPVSDDVASRWGPRIVDFAKAVAAAARTGT
jgi:iron complex transport system substrate-binding protein